MTALSRRIYSVSVAVMLSIALFFVTAPPGFAAATVRNDLAFGLNNRTDQLDWNIAGDLNGQNPNILSELTWSDLEIQQLTFDLRSELIGLEGGARGNPALRFSLGYGSIYSGRNQDSDYLTDNRTNEFSRSSNRSDDGDVLDVTLGVGGVFRFAGERYSVTPLIGYGFYRQSLTMTDGYQVIPATGPFSGLNSSYDATWRGPWIGFDAKAQVWERLAFTAGAELHKVTFVSKADWNLRSDFAHPTSFRQTANGYGLVGRFGIEYLLAPNLLLMLKGEASSFQASNGTDTVYFSDGTIGMTRLNRVNWTSSTLSTGLQFRF